MRQGLGECLVGIGGWEHEILDACFYPRQGGSSAQKLEFYARYFDAAEVRATFWDESINDAQAREWCRSVEAHRKFSFSVKLHAMFTHRREFRPQATRNIRGVLQELSRAGKLGTLLAQMPYAFTNTSANRFHLVKIAEVFRGFPLHVELRHNSWNQPSASSFLAENGICPVSADLPRINNFMPFLTRPFGTTAYLRFHGRNEKGWLVSAWDARYDYLYNGREMIELRRRTEGFVKQAEKTIVIFNNCTLGKAVANALQLRSALLEGARLPVPQAALKAFPHLAAIAGGDEPALFAHDAYKEAI